jgi:hypothetical protein
LTSRQTARPSGVNGRSMPENSRPSAWASRRQRWASSSGPAQLRGTGSTTPRWSELRPPGGLSRVRVPVHQRLLEQNGWTVRRPRTRQHHRRVSHSSSSASMVPASSRWPPRPGSSAVRHRRFGFLLLSGADPVQLGLQFGDAPRKGVCYHSDPAAGTMQRQGPGQAGGLATGTQKGSSVCQVQEHLPARSSPTT